MDPVDLEAAGSDTTISSLSRRCTSGFIWCVESSFFDNMEAITDAQGRFNVWAANLGALQPPQSMKSLDSRLKEAELMRKSVIAGLERLEGVQTRTTQILTGKQPNRKPSTTTFDTASPEATGLVVDELHELTLNMKACIDHLFGLSMLIRRLRPRGRFRQLTSFQSSIAAQRDTVTIVDRFPKTKHTPWLAYRLGRATDQRRQFFTYRQQHRGRLGNVPKTKVTPDGDDSITLDVATTVATTFDEGNDSNASQSRLFEPGHLRLDRGSVITSATSFVSDFDDSGHMGRRIPELPDMTLDGVQLDYDEPIECPYCRTIQTFTNRQTWKKHVFSDLQPYVCTFENCSVTPFSTRNEWFRHELDSHHHKDAVTNNQIDLILGACETPMTKFDASACPLCSEWEPPLDEKVNTREFRRHLSRHLQQISLDALPLYIEGLEIAEGPNEEHVIERYQGIVVRDYFDGNTLRLGAGDEVLVLDDIADESLWQVWNKKTGEEIQIPREIVAIRGTTAIQMGPDPSKLRTWTSSSNSFQVSAQFIGVEHGSITLHKANGVKIKVPRDTLSTQDIAYIDNITGTQSDSDDHTDSGIGEDEEGGPSAGSRLYAPVSARVPKYCFAEDKFWFIIEVLMEDGQTWELARYYEDFYDLQIALLTEFPAEAGNTGTQKRTLPYLPGPVNYVNDYITEGRVHNLDAYIKNLLAQPTYISECNLVKRFFRPREGDSETDAVKWRT
ncbi:ankyrin repeat protein [Diaporthe amygdali]|uniref:ankyrin repeat protein n=1 Tax=Phomopsis amygdali TaxID=1214568 RepID=UPI0022FF33F1|nr:ankyrin repeat protein [Diaporthe amygdali]KAJ0120191.1 ankyrin repeat protein [Diaporthe amygdali]